MIDWHFAQLNLARLRQPLNHPDTAGFVDRLDSVNAEAEGADGFVSRFVDTEGDAATGYMHDADDPMVITNLSVWRDVAALRAFVFDQVHRAVMSRRKEWFERPDVAMTVLWWIPAGKTPSVHNAMDRLFLLRRIGPGPLAFGLGGGFDPPAVELVGLDPRPVSVAVEGSTTPEAEALIAAYLAELVERSPEGLSFDDARMDPAEVDDAGGAFLVMRANSGEALGCAALRHFSDGVVEIKRMYLAPAARGRGLGRRLLDELHAEALRLGYRLSRLDTKVEVVEALDLYRSAGYISIPDYNANPDATHWFERTL